MNDVMEQIKTLSATLDEETTRFHPTGKLLLLGSYESVFLKAVKRKADLLGIDCDLTQYPCPHCGEVINTVDIASIDSGGRLWYDFLERLGYYVPYEKRTKENDWYGKDMVLDNEQAKQLVDYAVKKEVYNWDGVEWIVTEALAHGNKVVINADW